MPTALAARSAASPAARGSTPARHGLASSRHYVIGLRVEKTRRRPAVPDNLPPQAKNLHEVLLKLSFAIPASKTPIPYSTRLIFV
jgi:hypothetical protein